MKRMFWCVKQIEYFFSNKSSFSGLNFYCPFQRFYCYLVELKLTPKVKKLFLENKTKCFGPYTNSFFHVGTPGSPKNVLLSKNGPLKMVLSANGVQHNGRVAAFGPRDPNSNPALEENNYPQSASSWRVYKLCKKQLLTLHEK